MVIRSPVIKAADAPLRAAAKFTTVVARPQTQTRKARESQAPEPFYCTTQEHCDGSDYYCPYYAFPAISSRKTFSLPFIGGPCGFSRPSDRRDERARRPNVEQLAEGDQADRRRAQGDRVIVSHRALVLVLLLVEGRSTIAEILEHVARRCAGLLLIPLRSVRVELVHLARVGLVDKSTAEPPEFALTDKGRAQALVFRQVLACLADLGAGAPGPRARRPDVVEALSSGRRL